MSSCTISSIGSDCTTPARQPRDCKAMAIAAEICVYTNGNLVIEALDQS